jgi:hypothetical protein
MPRDPKGERRPRDVIGNAVHVMKLATGQIAAHGLILFDGVCMGINGRQQDCQRACR